MKQLIADYPYVPLYKVLLARNYKAEGHSDFRDALRQAALQAPDRMSLYEFLHHDLSEVEDVATSVPEEEISEETKKQPAAKKEEQRIEEEIVQEEVMQGDIEVSVVEEVETPVHADLVVVEEEETGNEVESEEARALINEQMLQTAAQKNVSLEEKHTFLEWLDILEGQPVNKMASTDEKTSVSEPDVVTVLEDQIDEYSAAQSYEADLQREVVDMEEEEGEVLLDTASSEQVKALADKSLEMNTGVVTETLAKLMLMQGKKSESIALYEQLRLKYPEKSDYFAARIEAIKAT